MCKAIEIRLQRNNVKACQLVTKLKEELLLEVMIQIIIVIQQIHRKIIQVEVILTVMLSIGVHRLITAIETQRLPEQQTALEVAARQEVVHQEGDNIMRKLTLNMRILFCVFTASFLHAQELHEIVQYTTEELHGSARYQALAGAFGALGGDLSAISSNPASSTVFALNEAGITLGLQTYTTDNAYFNSTKSKETSTFDVGQAGFVLVFVKPNSDWDKIAFGFNTQLANNFNKTLYAQGLNTQRGLADYFLDISGITLDRNIPFSAYNLNDNIDFEYARLGESYGADAQRTYMAYQTGLIDYFPSDAINPNPSYGYYDDKGLGIDQIHDFQASGGQRKYTLNFSGRYLKKLSLGVNLNIYSIDYRLRKSTSDKYVDSGNSFLDQVDFIQELQSFGTGVSVQFGALYKASDILRLGLNYTSPTYYEFEDEYSEGLDVRYNEDLDGASGRSIYPNVINVLPAYNLKTPSITQASLALVFGSNGLLSLDYGLKNYASTKVSDDFNGFDYLNDEINSNLDAASFLRAGGETRFGDISLRAGYWFEQTPYKNSQLMNDRSGFALGTGIRFGNASLDLTYTKVNQDYQQQLYSIGLTDSIDVQQQTGNISLSYNVRF